MRHLALRVRTLRAYRALSCLLALSGVAGGQTPRSLLSSRATESLLSASLASADAFHPYPTLRERAAWDSVPDAVRAAYLREAERQRGVAWGSIPASVMLRFVRDGNRADYDRMNTQRRQRLATLVMAEVLENRGRFLDEIADGIWAISEQTFWGSNAHMSLQTAGVGLADASEPVVDLFAAETAALLAWTDYLLGDRLDSVSPRLRERIRYEVDRRVLTPALEREDFWWMGFGTRRIVNNWNPWINSNWLASVLILEKDPQRRVRAVHKIVRSLDRFLDPYPADGGCDEGPGYWDRAAGSLFDNLELLRVATDGKIDVYDAPLVRNMGQYIYRAHIKDDYFVNLGDAAARLTPDAELIYRYGTRIHDPVMQGFGAYVQQRRGVHAPGNATLGRVLPALLGIREISAAKAAEPLLGNVWLPDLQLMAARAEPSSGRGLYLSAWGGHNAQSHNHNDVGNFVVFADGRPVLIDVGVEVYSAKTFSPQRYDVWTMQSAFHNLPTINGVMQKDGEAFRAERVEYSASRGVTRFALDIAKAYPASAAVTSWRRTLELKRGARVVDLHEDYVLARATAPMRLSFMTPLLVDVSAPGEVRLRASSGDGAYTLRYDASKFTASAEEIPIADARLRPIWGERLARIVLTGKGTPPRDSFGISIAYAK